MPMQVCYWFREGFSLSLSVDFRRPDFMERMGLATCVKVPLDYGAVF